MLNGKLMFDAQEVKCYFIHAYGLASGQFSFRCVALLEKTAVAHARGHCSLTAHLQVNMARALLCCSFKFSEAWSW